MLKKLSIKFYSYTIRIAYGVVFTWSVGVGARLAATSPCAAITPSNTLGIYFIIASSDNAKPLTKDIVLKVLIGLLWVKNFTSLRW